MTVTGAVVSALIYFAAALVALVIERRLATDRRPAPNLRLNYLLTAFNMALNPLFALATGILTVMVVNALGGGWITIPSSGWGLVAGVIAYALTVDGLEYAFHRAQHRFPALWALHSLHHSDTAMSSATTGRHHWVEHGIKVLSIYLLAGIIFKANAIVLAIYFLLSFYNLFSHMNLRIGFGRMSFVMNSPQYHRIHHSALPEHYNCNYASLFPIFDVIFRTYRQPRAGEYPPTGIEGERQPSTLADALLWPARVRQSRGEVAVK